MTLQSTITVPQGTGFTSDGLKESKVHSCVKERRSISPSNTYSRMRRHERKRESGRGLTKQNKRVNYFDICYVYIIQSIVDT